MSSSEDHKGAPLSSDSSTKLKYLAYGIYLQLFLGLGCLAIAVAGVDTGALFEGPQACGGLLILLGINSLFYIRRYKQSLASNR